MAFVGAVSRRTRAKSGKVVARCARLSAFCQPPSHEQASRVFEIASAHKTTVVYTPVSFSQGNFGSSFSNFGQARL